MAKTDTGHSIGPGLPEILNILSSSFAFKPDGTLNSTLMTDFNERSPLELAVKTRALTQAYYLQPQKFAYFEGCSTGGRQGYYMLQNHPEQYDGYILGAPSMSWAKFVTAGEMYPQVVAQRELGGVVPTAAQRNLVNGQAVSTCDVVGGQHLGFVLDPEQCKYDPTRDASVLCAGTTGAGGVVGTNSTAACVSPVQAQAMNKGWFGATPDGSVPDPAVNNGYNPTVTGAQLWYGLSRGTDTSTVAGANAVPLATDVVAMELQNTLYGGPFLLNASGNGANLWTTLTYGQLANAFYQGIALQPFIGNLDTDAKANLAAVKAAKAKVLTWHGLADTAIPPANTINYYTRVVANDGGFANTQTYDRLFMIGGLAHCTGIGTAQGTPGVSPPADVNSVPLPAAGQLFDVVKAWVENGTAPDTITLQSANASASQLLCPYPKKPTYKGSGAISTASSYTCK